MAALQTNCLDGVVGLANCACDCFEDDAPEAWNTATSGLFVADILPLNMAVTADNCTDPESPWVVLARAMEEGKRMTIKDINAGLMAANQYTRKPWKGLIGEAKNRNVVTLSKAYAGARIWSQNIKGAYIKNIKIGGVFDTVGSVVVTVYNQFNQIVGSTVTLTTTAGGHVQQSFATNLPMWQDGAPDCQYFLSFEAATSPQPRAVRPICPGCNGISIPVFNSRHPYSIGGKYQRNLAWANWIMVGGWERDNVTDFDLIAESFNASEVLNGLTIECELDCEPFTSVCLGSLDYSDPVALSLAHALRYAAAINAAEKIIRTVSPESDANVSRQILATDIQQWWADYEKNIKYVTYHANTRSSDCIFCKPAFSMSINSKTP
jgi:hypothetical protein